MGTYDRYSTVRSNGVVGRLPFVKIRKKNTDFYEVYERGITRFDKLSQKYYDNPNYDWLILMANPQYGAFEFLIPNNASLRIPYPLKQTIEEYNISLKQILKEQNNS